MRSYLLSWLSKKHRGATLEAFAAAEPSSWVVWEAGPWRPPTRSRDTIVSQPDMPRLESGESLAIQLVARDGGTSVTLGRDAENDVVIDDATLSRAHMRFERAAGGSWTVRDLGSSNGTRVDGVKLREEAAPVRSGSSIEAGAVRLTFYDPAGLLLRLRAVA
ncbi:MAG TPA: FHA domain-containing protein [Anaeromyxobacteraceae bacterium]|nr:FHA domain-containing protein [Anaeromyxobacteraceae bacterium]